ncbi:MAG: hypothetical protein K2K37_00520 [Muribaculaceae bacterium]|nr:hypothetical protein [Muribaculaceae bacterium]
MKRKLLAAALAVCAVSTWGAPGDINALRIHCRSGENVTILLDDDPLVRFENLDLVIATDKNVLNFPSAEAEKLTYVSADPGGISSTVLPDALFTFGEESLKIANLATDTSVAIYTVDGKLISSAITDGHGNATLTLPGQSASVYIVQTPSVSFKIRRP